MNSQNGNINENSNTAPSRNMNVGTARNQYLPPHGGNRNRAANIPETIRQFNKSIDPSNSEVNRVYPTSSDHYLNGLGLVTKYYYNIIDWSPKNFIAVALLEKVFIINVATTGADLFKDFNSNTYVVTSLKFSKDGALLAVGFENGFMHIFTVDTKQLVRKFNAEVRGIGSVAWTSGGLLSYGNCNGRIQTHDTRQHVSLLSETRHHGNKVCALNWVCNDKYLVSGSSDYIVNVYSKDTIIRQDPTVLYAFGDHTATVKAVTECPFMSRNIIATCGGMKDGTIKFWNLSTGELVTNVVAASKQTSAIVFDQHYGEMATTHGGNKNCINVWKYSAASSKFSLAHEIKCVNRPINMVKSACDGFVLVTNAAQQLEFFDLFKKDEEESLRKKHFGFNGIR